MAFNTSHSRGGRIILDGNKTDEDKSTDEDDEKSAKVGPIVGGVLGALAGLVILS